MALSLRTKYEYSVRHKKYLSEMRNGYKGCKDIYIKFILRSPKMAGKQDNEFNFNIKCYRIQHEQNILLLWSFFVVFYHYAASLCGGIKLTIENNFISPVLISKTSNHKHI